MMYELSVTVGRVMVLASGFIVHLGSFCFSRTTFGRLPEGSLSADVPKFLRSGALLKERTAVGHDARSSNRHKT
ncbi:hypothetical protein QBC36DRAFT_332197 [Triangularia setosa]|uniref:Uncharacterized protein n=1 Tax=Triangularia setosa TaxID=2587417 RepID=A0AAN6W654_9PEZI|nr:hypothetical protein QBC36DRAFT_332197 [Podospora setosa]